jgi:hypothetical protein
MERPRAASKVMVMGRPCGQTAPNKWQCHFTEDAHEEPWPSTHWRLQRKPLRSHYQLVLISAFPNPPRRLSYLRSELGTGSESRRGTGWITGSCCVRGSPVSPIRRGQSKPWFRNATNAAFPITMIIGKRLSLCAYTIFGRGSHHSPFLSTLSFVPKASFIST